MESGAIQFALSLAPTRDPVLNQLARRSNSFLLSFMLFTVVVVSQSLFNGPTRLAWAAKVEETETTEHRRLELCADCRLTARSIEELVRTPRQMDAYGQLSEKIDLEKMKKAVCKEVMNDKDREGCRSFYFNNHATVLKWKQAVDNARAGTVSFLDFVCIRELKLCCPENSFGAKCSKCPECGPNQQCLGEGTRTGNGSCTCKVGHTGSKCEQCTPGYYYDHEAMKLPEYSNRKVLCKKCHRSCKYCRTPGPKGCEVCQDGFSWQAGFGCFDIDECVQSNKQICGPNTFCVNTEGSYFCYECDRACDGCHGDGPDMCLRCGRGYRKDSNGNCVAERKTILPPEANYYRYAIYAGLCACTCIILSNNVYLASLVGLGVALYIGASEYVMLLNPGLADDHGKNLAAGLPEAYSAMSLPHIGL